MLWKDSFTLIHVQCRVVSPFPAMALRRSLLLCFLAAVLAQVCAADPSSIFRHGIMSGDPTPDAVILWTRVTVSESANVQVGWRVSETNRFLASSSPAVLMEGVATTGADVDFTVHVDVTGLSPYTHYYYVFYYDDPSTGEIVYSTIGRTMTSPALGQSVESLKMGVASCAHWLWGYFHPYAALAEVEDLDIVIFLGDYIYEVRRHIRFKSIMPHFCAFDLRFLSIIFFNVSMASSLFIFIYSSMGITLLRSQSINTYDRTLPWSLGERRSH